MKHKLSTHFLLVVLGLSLLLTLDPIALGRSGAVESEKRPATLLCFTVKTKHLRISNVEEGCSTVEKSLGAGAIKHPPTRPTSLNPQLTVRFLAAQAAAKREGYRLSITSGYRSYATQTLLFKAAVKKYGRVSEATKWVLPPDLSHHPWGTAIDVNYPKDPLPTKWLARYGYKYGLCRAYENEWWHFEGLTAPGTPCPKRLLNASRTPRE